MKKYLLALPILLLPLPSFAQQPTAKVSTIIGIASAGSRTKSWCG